MTPATWIANSTDPRIIHSIVHDPVLPLYNSIVAQFGSWAPLTWGDCIVSLHIVYGWMPTIPDLSRPARCTAIQQATVVNLLNSSRARQLTNAELDFLASHFVNNSIVGVSKMLHFLAPDRYPIWDSRVARAWFAPAKCPYTALNNSTTYVSYLTDLSVWIGTPPIAAALGVLRGVSLHLSGVSNIRLMELVLFHS